VEAKGAERRNVVASGRTVQDAVANGLTMLGVRQDQVDVEVLSEGSRGLLGFGAENARVRLTVKPAPQTRPPAPIPEPPAAQKVETPARQPAAAPAPVPVPEPSGQKSAAELAGSDVLSELLGLMGIQANVESRLSDDLAEDDQSPPMVLNITGDDLGILIGRRGETLAALQYLVRLMVSHRIKKWSNLVVDVEDCRVRQRHTLEGLARRVADEVARTGRSQSLEPMPPYDRRLIHIALRSHPKVTTHSVGQGERRKVTILPRR